MAKYVSKYAAPKYTRRDPSIADKIWASFDRAELRRVCEMPEEEFAATYGLGTYRVEQVGADFYCYQDNGSNILAVAHLDTVSGRADRGCQFVDTEAGPVVFSRALDDRLGAYIILDLLPKLGIVCDVLLTVGEESGQSTARFFDPPKHYNWMIEFDRGGTDVVLYQYDDKVTADLVSETGATVGDGIFSDISVLEHLECKGFNWGVGYRDYHGPRSHAFLDDTFEMLEYFVIFHDNNADDYLPHDEAVVPTYSDIEGRDDDRSWPSHWPDHWRDEYTEPRVSAWDTSVEV